MYPHPVYIPTGEIRELRALLTRRRMLQTERNRWHYRSRAALRASGRTLRTGGHYLRRSLKGYLEKASDLEAPLREMLALYHRQERALALELRRVNTELRRKARAIDAIKRLETIPAVGDLMATTIYAWVGEIGRFPDAKSLAAYAGLVPSVYQSAASQRSGGITKQGSKALRSALVQSAHVLTNRCRTAEARPLQEIGQRVRTFARPAQDRHGRACPPPAAHRVLRLEVLVDQQRASETCASPARARCNLASRLFGNTALLGASALQVPGRSAVPTRDDHGKTGIGRSCPVPRSRRPLRRRSSG